VLYYPIIELTTLLALRVEWAKAKARAARWQEEVILLDEEMRRVLQFCGWKADWWRNQIGLRNTDTTDNLVLDGLKAFAEQQAAQEVRIATDWAAKWRAVRIRAKPIIDGIPDNYCEVHDGESDTVAIYIEDEDEDDGNGDF